MSVRPLLIFFLFFSFAAHGFALIERVVEKTFPVSSGALLKVDTFHGAIRVQTDDLPEIRVLLRESFDLKTEAEADRVLKDFELDLEPSERKVAITARYHRSLRWAWENWPPVTLAFEIRCPKNTSLDLTSREGNITVLGGIKGAIAVRALAGTIFIGETDGEISASSAHGDISVTASTGALTLTAKSGNILVGRTGGTTHLSGAGGAIEVQSARGRIEAETDGADLKVGFVHPITEPSELHTSGGDVWVNLDARSACTLDARSSRFASVKARDLPVAVTTGELGSSHVVGTVNGGGPKIVIEASGGGVRLVGVPPTP
jgi:hypothetical protein